MGGTRRSLAACVVALAGLLPMTTGCVTTLVLTAASKSGVADEHIGPAKEAAKEVAGSARDAAEQVAEAVQDTFESIGEDFGD